MEEIRTMARDVLSLLWVVTGILVTVGFAANFVGQQVLTLTGNPLGLSRLWVRVVAMIFGLLLVIFAPLLSDWVIQTLVAMGL